eukprot:sb/3461291/
MKRGNQESAGAGHNFERISLQDLNEFSDDSEDESESEALKVVPERPEEWEPFPKMGAAHLGMTEETRYWTALHQYVEKEDVAGASELLDITDIEDAEQVEEMMLTYDKDRGITPLEMAAEKGSVQLVELMLTYIDFLINLKLGSRRQSIVASVEGGIFNMHGRIHRTKHLQHKKFFSRTNYEGKAAIHYAAGRGHGEIINMLVEAGADIFLTDCNKCNALFYVASSPDITCGDERVACLQLILSMDVNHQMLQQVDVDRYTLLHGAAYNGCIKSIKYIVEHYGDHLDVNSTDNKGKMSPLYIAAKRDQLEAVQYLLPMVTDFEKDCRNGNKAIILHEAVESNANKVGRFLCETDGFDDKHVYDIGNIWEATPFSGAVSGNNVEAMRYLTEKMDAISNEDIVLFNPNGPSSTEDVMKYQNKFRWTCLHDAAIRGYCEAAQFICDNKYSQSTIFEKDKNENMPIHLAARGGYVEMLRILASHHIKKHFKGININAVNVAENTVLHEAANNGHAEAVKFLLGLPSINVTLQNENKYTALHLAIIARDLDTLAAFGVYQYRNRLPFLVKDRTGKTPLHLAISRSFTAGALQLIRMGGDMAEDMINEIDIEEITPLALAAFRSNKEVLDAILAFEGDRKMVLEPYLSSNNNWNFKNRSNEGIFPWFHAKGLKHFLENNEAKIKWHASNGLKSSINTLILKHPRLTWDLLSSSYMEYVLTPWELDVNDIDLHSDAHSDISSVVKADIDTPDKPEVYRVIIDFDMLESYEETMDLENNTDFKTVGGFYQPLDYISDKNPLQVMAKNQPILLIHPVVEALLDRKWDGFAKRYYYFLVFLNIAYLLGYSSLIIILQTEATVSNKLQDSALLAGVIILVCGIMRLVIEIMDFADEVFIKAMEGLAQFDSRESNDDREEKLDIRQIRDGLKRYFTDETNITEVAFYLSSIIFLCLVFSAENLDESPWQLAAFSVLFGISNTLLLLRACDIFNIGLYIIMFKRIVATFIKSIALLFCILLGSFAFIFHILLTGQDTEFGLLASIGPYLKVLSMGTSGIEYEDGDLVGTKDFKSSFGFIFSLALFCIIIQILFINLTTGLAIEDVKLIRDNSQAAMNAIRVEEIFECERILAKASRYCRHRATRSRMKRLLFNGQQRFWNMPAKKFR